MRSVNIINKSNNPLPKYETLGSAGMDLYADLKETVTLQPLERALIPTGLYIALPNGFEAQIRPRSGLALRKGLSIPNAPATIDSDYRGEIKVIVINLSNEPLTIEPGERFCQMVIAQYEKIQWFITDSLEDTDRGDGGFGSTGDKH
jgi:dUTP pyrophosphatase